MARVARGRLGRLCATVVHAAAEGRARVQRVSAEGANHVLRREVVLEEAADEQEVAERRLAAVGQMPTFMASVAAREGGQISPGSYFTYVLHTRMVSKRGPEGSRRSFSVLVVVGNGQGTAGLGMAKDLAPNAALMKATHAARRQLVHIDRFDGRTIFHDMEERYGPTKIVIRTRRAHSGTRCNWLAWKIFSAFGITDLSCRMHGSNNNINQARCIVNALLRMDTPQQIAARRGKRVLDMTVRQGQPSLKEAFGHPLFGGP